MEGKPNSVCRDSAQIISDMETRLGFIFVRIPIYIHTPMGQRKRKVVSPVQHATDNNESSSVIPVLPLQAMSPLDKSLGENIRYKI